MCIIMVEKPGGFMSIIAVASTKGGPGKTTLAVHLADAFHRAGSGVAALDLDPNTNLTRWLEKGRIDDVALHTCLDEDAVVSTALELGRSHDFVILDVPGFGARSLVYAVGVADFVLIPSKSSEDDVLEAIKTRNIVRQTAELARRTIPHAAVLTQVDPRTRVYLHSRRQFEAFGVPVLEAFVPARTVYQQARFEGLSVLGMDNTEAKDDITRLANDIIAAIP
jgi:chromosome partitioning protein